MPPKAKGKVKALVKRAPMLEPTRAWNDDESDLTELETSSDEEQAPEPAPIASTSKGPAPISTPARRITRNTSEDKASRTVDLTLPPHNQSGPTIDSVASAASALSFRSIRLTNL